MLVVAIDTGATKIAGAVIDENGVILEKIQLPNIERTGSSIIEVYLDIITEFQKNYRIDAVGIGAGGRIEPTNGKVLFATDVYTDYIGLSIVDEVTKKCGLPTVVDNDCRVAVYGEYWKGAVKGFDDVFGIILGTGVGGGYIQAGKPIYGAACSAGEIGHLILHPGGKRCLCGQRGCVEQYLSGTALWESYNVLSGKKVISSGYEFFELLDDGDDSAQSILDIFIYNLAICAISIANLISPNAILFGGGLIDTADRWWNRFEETYIENGSSHCRNVSILRAKAGNNAALLGAAWMTLNSLSKTNDIEKEQSFL
ncbi:MAG: ROK family protein [Oscillospiraceae bacterium]|nr:ROK family protein [Oscillospiraceae bacterium]